MVKRISADNFCDCLDNLVEQLKERKDDDWAHKWLDDVLNVFLGEDFFGTEGQSDPRGDHRDNDIYDES